MRHPSKVGAFCARRGDAYLGRGGPRRVREPNVFPLPTGRNTVLFGDRLRSRRLRDASRAAKHWWETTDGERKPLAGSV